MVGKWAFFLKFQKKCSFREKIRILKKITNFKKNVHPLFAFFTVDLVVRPVCGLALAHGRTYPSDMAWRTVPNPSNMRPWHSRRANQKKAQTVRRVWRTVVKVCDTTVLNLPRKVCGIVLRAAWMIVWKVCRIVVWIRARIVFKPLRRTREMRPSWPDKEHRYWARR